MTEHERGTRQANRELTVLTGQDHRPTSEKRDLVVDLSGVRELNLTSLALLLTAQRNAQEENRSVWLAGLPGQMWEALYAMGLGPFFKAFPKPGQAAGPA